MMLQICDKTSDDIKLIHEKLNEEIILKAQREEIKREEAEVNRIIGQ